MDGGSFFDWPVKRWNRNALIFGLGFGLTDNWVAFDEVTNPYNVAIGAGRWFALETRSDVILTSAIRQRDKFQERSCF